MSETKTMLQCDELDHKAIVLAMAQRERAGPIPDGDGNAAGRTIAEICRGWQDYHSWYSDDKGTDAQQQEIEWAEQEGFGLTPLKNEIERRIKTIKGIEIIGSGAGADAADISFYLDSQKFSLVLTAKDIDNA